MYLKSAMCEDNNQANHLPPSRLGSEFGTPRVGSQCGHIVHRSFDKSYKHWIASLGWTTSPLHSSTLSRIGRVDAGAELGKGLSCTVSEGRLPARPPEFKRIWRLPMLPTQRHVMHASFKRLETKPPGFGSRRAESVDLDLSTLDDKLHSGHSPGERTHG